MRDERDQEPTGTLEQFTAIVGHEAALQLSMRYGGRRLYIPLEPARNSELVELIGEKAALLLARRFGGVHFEMPLERGKRERILLLSKEGLSVREIAAAVQCTERHVKYVRAEYRENGGALVEPGPRPDPNQMTLFGAGDAAATPPTNSPEGQ